MADEIQKITELIELATAAPIDLLPIVSDPAGTPITQRITVANLLASTLPLHGKADTAGAAETATALAAGADRTKLDGIAAGAEVNVQADWTASSGDAQILNQPTLGTAAVKDIPASGNASATEVVYGTDTRLSDVRTPTAHGHAPGDVTGTAVIMADSRLSDARVPTTHDNTKHSAAYLTANVFNDAEGDPAPIGAEADGTSVNAARRDHVHAGDHVDLASKGTNTHAQIDIFIDTKAAASGLASLDASSKLVQPRARADDGLGYVVLANDTLAQNYAVNSATKITVTAARTLTTTVPPANCRATTMVRTSGTTSYVITFGTGFKPVGTLATGTTNARVFVVNWISDGVSLYEAGRTAAMVA